MAATLSARLPGERWFSGKARSVARVRPLDWAGLPGSAATLALFEVTGEAGDTERYFVPLRDADPGAEALDDAGVCAAIVEAMRTGAEVPGARGVFRFASTAVLPEILPVAPTTTRSTGAEQSNTSRVLGERAMLKVIRRTETGMNPELELTRFLTAETQFREAPRLAGSLVWEGEAGPLTLATLHELV
ncbi:MAG: sugar phosphotransferase, partial [Candidatus Rokuibacteriota bacterium]